MKKITNTRNKIIIFEIFLLFIMLLISYKIYVVEEGLINLSNKKIQILFSIHRLEHEIEDISLLNKNYILTGNKTFKEKYFNILNQGYGLDKKITNNQLYSIIKEQSFSKIEKNIIDTIFKNYYSILELQQKAIKLFDNNKKTEAKKIIFSNNFKFLRDSISQQIKILVQTVNNKIDFLFKIQKQKVYAYFALLAIIGTLFVFINIYFFIYLANIAMKQLKEKNNLIKEVENFNDKLEDEVNKRTAEIKQLMKVKSEFLANMSHEIRTPLNAMFGFIRILQEKDFDVESQKYLSIIEKSGQNLLAIINDILDFSKIEAGKLNIEKIECNPEEEIEVIYTLFNSLAHEKNITLEINKNLKYNIITDPVRLKQVIANLLSNAIKFSKIDSKIILNLIYNEKLEKLYVEVIDEGIGISKDKLKNIFEAFSQADNSTTRKYGGTGLGLTISSKLISILGGELKVESEVGKGSTFYFSIPAKKTVLITKTQVEIKKSISNKKFDGNVLLVEDNKANQMFMKVILNKMGLKFEIANNGIEAIDKFTKGKYDVILMDENMPNMNGIEATNKIREIEKENFLNHTPIIALTANAMEGDKERFIKAGMDYYLSKPLEIEKLQYILEKI